MAGLAHSVVRIWISRQQDVPGGFAVSCAGEATGVFIGQN